MPDPHRDELRRLIKAQQVVALVGAGVSIGATNCHPVASWVGLVKDGIDRCVRSDKTLAGTWEERARRLVESSDVDDLLAAADRITKKLGGPTGPAFSHWLRHTVGALQAVD